MQSLLARVGRPHTQMTCSRCSPGRVAPYSSTAYCSPCKGGTYAANATSCASCPEGYYCSGAAPLPEICQDVSSYCPAGSSRADNRQSRHVHKPQAHSDDRVRRRLLLLERTSPQVPVGILLPCWSSKPHCHPRGHVHERKSNKRVSVRGKLLLR